MASILDIILSGTTGDAQVWVLPNVRGEGKERWIGARDSDRLEAYGKKQDQAGHGIFFCVSTIGHNLPRKKENAVELRFLFADIDFKHIDLTPEEILQRLLALPHPPSRVHHTGHGYHCFWILVVPVGADQFERAEALLKRLAFLVGGDVQVCHRAALLRLPGSHNTKTDERKLVQVVRETNATYGLDEMDRWLSSVSAPIIPKTGAQVNPFLQAADNQASKPPVDVEARLAAMQVNGGDINGVHPSQLSITASLTSKGMDEDEIVEIVLGATKELAGTSDWNWTREEQTIRAMCRDASKKFDAKKRPAKPLSSDIVSLKSATPGDKGKDDNDAPDEAIAPAYSDEALALRFTARYPNLRFTAKWNQWSIFDGTRWKTDETRAVFSCARIVCREAAREANAAKAAKAIASSKTRSAVVSMASDDRRTAATVDQWDVNPWLLNTPGGTVDLRTGTTRGHDPDDYATKITAVSPDPSCPTPLFDRFLDRVTRSDEEYKSYLQRVSGYSLTGLTDEHAMFFLHGGGGNGKSVLMGTIMDIIGDYHRTAPIEAFTDAKNERHSTELAMLRGARLVTATETEEGRSWAESKIKQLTGGDKITARFMRQDFFEFVPQFKLMISGNNKPGLKSVDDAIRRRFNLLPFAVKITDEEKDPELRGKLKAEWPGILAWMIEGCLDWRDRGLMPPAVVTSATDEYLNEQDAIGRWVEQCCTRDINAFTTLSDLFEAWDLWADTLRERRLNSQRFGDRLNAMGFERCKQGGKRGHRGIKGPSVNTFSRYGQ